MKRLLKHFVALKSSGAAAVAIATQGADLMRVERGWGALEQSLLLPLLLLLVRMVFAARFFFLQKSIVSLDLTCMTFFPMVSATLEQTTSHFCDALERRLNLVSGRDREGIIPEKQHLKTTHQEIRAK